MTNSRKAKLNREVEEIKRLKDLNKILKTGDMENALLSNAAKDSETLNDNVLDAMLQRTDAESHGQKGLEAIEKLITSGGGYTVTRSKKVKVKKSKGKTKVKRSFHAVKKKSSANKSKKAKKSRRR